MSTWISNNQFKKDTYKILGVYMMAFSKGKPQKSLATKKRITFFEAGKKIKMWPLNSSGDGKALVAGPLKKELFLRLPKRRAILNNIFTSI